MGEATARKGLEWATTERQSRPPATVRMPARPRPPSSGRSPVACSVEMPAVPLDVVVFPGERLATVDDFVRLRLQARSITFLGVLMRAGISPAYYASMCERFAAARRADPSLESTYRARLDLASRPR